MDNKTLYDSFLKEIQRLELNEPLQRIAINYVYKQIPDDEAIRLFNHTLPTFNITLLKHKLVYEATVKALYVMRNSYNKTEFLAEIQKHIAKNETIAFDEILEKLLKIKP